MEGKEKIIKKTKGGERKIPDHVVFKIVKQITKLEQKQEPELSG